MQSAREGKTQKKNNRKQKKKYVLAGRALTVHSLTWTTEQFASLVPFPFHIVPAISLASCLCSRRCCFFFAFLSFVLLRLIKFEWTHRTKAPDTPEDIALRFPICWLASRSSPKTYKAIKSHTARQLKSRMPCPTREEAVEKLISRMKRLQLSRQDKDRNVEFSKIQFSFQQIPSFR